jgi:ATP-dependent RNA helicase DeaD
VTALEELHLTPPIAAAVARLGWVADDPLVREAAPTAARGHNLVLAVPPSPTAATPAIAGMLSRLGEGRQGLLLCAPGQLEEWGRRVHLLTGGSLRIQLAQGTSRATRRLKAGEVDLLVASPETAAALQGRSALRGDALAAVLLAWPESWEDRESLTPLMQDLPKDAQRIVLTAAGDQAEDLVERYARRALTLGLATLEGLPSGPVRTASVSWGGRAAALTDIVEQLDPTTLVVWTADTGSHQAIGAAVSAGGPDAQVVTGDAPAAQVVVAYDLPSAQRLRQLLTAGEVVLLVPPGAEAYVERIASPRRPLKLPGAADAAVSAAAARRATIVRALERGDSQRALLTLAPLFERHDPATVAAALFELWTTSAAAVMPAALPDIPAIAKIYVGIGKKDGATANDLVAVLTKEIRVERAKIGRVELRESYTLVEIPAQDAERVAGALNGVTIRRRRVTARVDRGGPSRPKRPAPRRA